VKISTVIIVLALLLAGCTDTSTRKQAIAPKVVIVTMFEIGELTGDKAGEFQLWKERRHLDERFPFRFMVTRICTTTDRAVSWGSSPELEQLDPQQPLWRWEWMLDSTFLKATG